MTEIKNEKEFLDLINSKILKKYDIELSSIEEADPNVLAFFNTQTKKISINKRNRLIFNDYIFFISTLQHENVHLLNNAEGIEDTYMDGDIQVHNQAFIDRMYEEYDFQVTDVYGGVDFNHKNNKAVFEKLIIEGLENKKLFEDLQEYFIKNIFKDTKTTEREKRKKQKGGNQDQDEPQDQDEEDKEKPEQEEQPDEYVFEEENGIEI